MGVVLSILTGLRYVIRSQCEKQSMRPSMSGKRMSVLLVSTKPTVYHTESFLNCSCQSALTWESGASVSLL